MSYKLTAILRKGKGEKTRTEGYLPAVVYGVNKETISLNLSPTEFSKMYRQAGDSSLVDLTIDGKDCGKVLVQEVQYEPVKDRVIHVDLRRIDMDKPLIAPVQLKFIGEAPVIKTSGGTLVTSLSVVQVKCLPKDLVSHIDVSLAVLVSNDTLIKIKDLQLPAGVVIVSPNAEDLVAKVTAALTEDEIKAMEADTSANVDLTKIESAKPKKEEAEEGAEGAAAPAAGKKEEKKEEKKK